MSTKGLVILACIAWLGIGIATGMAIMAWLTHNLLEEALPPLFNGGFIA